MLCQYSTLVRRLKIGPTYGRKTPKSGWFLGSSSYDRIESPVNLPVAVFVLTESVPYKLQLILKAVMVAMSPKSA
jgi:hypothetical protein